MTALWPSLPCRNGEWDRTADGALAHAGIGGGPRQGSVPFTGRVRLCVPGAYTVAARGVLWLYGDAGYDKTVAI